MLRQHHLGLLISATHRKWTFFLDWKSCMQLCASLGYHCSQGLESLAQTLLKTLSDQNLPPHYWKWHCIAHPCSTLCSMSLWYGGWREECHLFPQFSSFHTYPSLLLFRIIYQDGKALQLNISMTGKLQITWEEKSKRKVINKLCDCKMQRIQQVRTIYSCDFSKLLVLNPR